MDVEQIAEPDRSTSLARGAALAGCGVAAASLVLAALHGAPYLGFDSLNPWLVTFAIGLFALLAAVPFAVNERAVARKPERTEAWERSMLVLGAVAVPLAVLSALVVFAGSFSPAHSLADAAALLTLIETGLIVAVLGSWLVSG